MPLYTLNSLGGSGTATSGLTITTVKTASYTAAANQYVPVDTTAGNVTITLPTAPADGTRVGIKHVVRGGTNTVAIALGGSDVLNTAGGATTGTITLLNQGVILQYSATGAIWYATSSDLPLSQTDLRYAVKVPNPAAGRYVFPIGAAAIATSNNHGSNVLRLAPWVLTASLTIDRIGAEVTTVGDAGSKVRLGIYADNGSCYPGSLLLDAGQVAGDSATVQDLTVSLTLPAGLYWIGGAVQSVTTTQPTLRVPNIPTVPALISPGTSIPLANVTAVGYAQFSVTGALPGTFGSTIAAIGQVVRCHVRTA